MTGNHWSDTHDILSRMIEFRYTLFDSWAAAATAVRSYAHVHAAISLIVYKAPLHARAFPNQHSTAAQCFLGRS